MRGALFGCFLLFSGCRFLPQNAFSHRFPALRCSFVGNALFDGRKARSTPSRAAPLIYRGSPGRPFRNQTARVDLSHDPIFINKLDRRKRLLTSRQIAHRLKASPLVPNPLIRPFASPSKKPSDPAFGGGGSEKFCSPCRIVLSDKQKTTAHSSGLFRFNRSIFPNHPGDIVFKHCPESAGSLHHS